MQKMYRVFSLLLSAVIVMSAMFTVTAEENGITLTEKDYQVAERLEAIGIIDNANEEEMQKIPTRREVAELMISFINLPVSDDDDMMSPFIDVAASDESVAEITALYNMGYISRGDDLKFYPENITTANEAVTFVVKAMGYKTFA